MLITAIDMETVGIERDENELLSQALINWVRVKGAMLKSHNLFDHQKNMIVQLQRMGIIRVRGILER